MFDSIKDKIKLKKSQPKSDDSDEFDKEHAEYITNLALCMIQKKYDEGLKLLESHFNKNSPADWYNKGNFLGNLKRDEEAVQCYDEAIKMDNQYIKAWYRKANALLTLKRYLEAVPCYEKVIELEQKKDPENKDDKWSHASAFYCMIAYIYERDRCIFLKKPVPVEIIEGKYFWEEKTRKLLEYNHIIPKLDTETQFVNYCVEHFKDILDKLEPNVVVEFRD